MTVHLYGRPGRIHSLRRTGRCWTICKQCMRGRVSVKQANARPAEIALVLAAADQLLGCRTCSALHPVHLIEKKETWPGSSKNPRSSNATTKTRMRHCSHCSKGNVDMTLLGRTGNLEDEIR